MNLCPKCRWDLKDYDMASGHEDSECIANLAEDVESMREHIAVQHERISALEKVIAWWNECKRFEDGKVEP